MKKLSLLALVLIVGLPGCCGRKKRVEEPVRRNNIERYMSTEGDIETTEDDSDLEDELDLEDDLEDEYTDFDADEEDDSLDLEELGLSDDELDDILSSDDDVDTDAVWMNIQEDDEFKKLYFSFNHYGIREDQKESLTYDIEQVKQLVAEADGSIQPTIVIEGHACQEGDRAYNLALSEKRAKYVADLFASAGVDKNLIKVVGRGQECPTVVDGKMVNGSREDRAPNRRVEVRVIYT